MKNYIINKCIKFIKKYNNYSNEKIEEIKYGLLSIYLTISKLIVIFSISLVLGIIKDVFIFTLIYNIIRMPSFGLHATKSWICLLSSTIIFIGIPYLCKLIDFPIIIKIIICSAGVCLMFKNSPADTYKRPIVNKKRRNIYKTISVVITFVYSILIVNIKNSYMSNIFLFSIILQNCMISPTVYRIFKLPYNNYKIYLENEQECSQLVKV